MRLNLFLAFLAMTGMVGCGGSSKGNGGGTLITQTTSKEELGKADAGKDEQNSTEHPNPVSAKVTETEAEKIALQEVPGEVTDIAIERKLGKDVYVVEVLAKDGGAEIDVFVDIETGKVLGTDK